MLCPRLLEKVVRLLRFSDFAGRSAGLVIGKPRPVVVDAGGGVSMLGWTLSMATP